MTLVYSLPTANATGKNIRKKPPIRGSLQRKGEEKSIQTMKTVISAPTLTPPKRENKRAIR